MVIKTIKFQKASFCTYILTPRRRAAALSILSSLMLSLERMLLQGCLSGLVELQNIMVTGCWRSL